MHEGDYVVSDRQGNYVEAILPFGPPMDVDSACQTRAAIAQQLTLRFDSPDRDRFILTREVANAWRFRRYEALFFATVTNGLYFDPL